MWRTSSASVESQYDWPMHEAPSHHARSTSSAVYELGIALHLTRNCEQTLLSSPSLDELEAAMIDLYKPRYNIKLKAPTPTTTPLTLTIGGLTIPFNQRPPHPRFERRI